jgi:hypothetical protein
MAGSPSQNLLGEICEETLDDQSRIGAKETP